MIKNGWIANFRFYVNSFIETGAPLDAVPVPCNKISWLIQRTNIYIEDNQSLLIVLAFIILFSI